MEYTTICRRSRWCVNYSCLPGVYLSTFAVRGETILRSGLYSTRRTRSCVNVECPSQEQEAYSYWDRSATECIDSTPLLVQLSTSNQVNVLIYAETAPLSRRKFWYKEPYVYCEHVSSPLSISKGCVVEWDC